MYNLFLHGTYQNKPKCIIKIETPIVHLARTITNPYTTTHTNPATRTPHSQAHRIQHTYIQSLRQLLSIEKGVRTTPPAVAAATAAVDTRALSYFAF